MCRMHQADHGVFLRIFNILCHHLESHGNLMKEVDNRIQNNYHHPFLKRFSNGIFELKNPSASEHRQISVCLPFILHGLNDSLLYPFIDTIITYLKWRKYLSSPGLTVSELEELQHLGKLLQHKMISLSSVATKKQSKITSMPKVYIYMCHIFFIFF